jgi:hypothetical protein
MTDKGCYENTLRELRKVKSASLHLSDYNYWGSKAIQELANERYNIFETTQQLSDDLQALTTSASFTVTSGLGGLQGAWTGGYTETPVGIVTGQRYGSGFYQFSSPADYWHMLGSHVGVVNLRPHKCYPAGYEISTVSKRLTRDIGNGIINNAYLKPDFKRPYHQFIDGSGGQVKPDLIYFAGDLNQYAIGSVYIDYLKEPRGINLTVAQRDLPLDTSDVMEWPEYVCQEIVKRIVKLVLEASSDPRLNTHIPVNQSIQP